MEMTGNELVLSIPVPKYPTDAISCHAQNTPFYWGLSFCRGYSLLILSLADKVYFWVVSYPSEWSYSQLIISSNDKANNCQ